MSEEAALAAAAAAGGEGGAAAMSQEAAATRIQSLQRGRATRALTKSKPRPPGAIKGFDAVQNARTLPETSRNTADLLADAAACALQDTPAPYFGFEPSDSPTGAGLNSPPNQLAFDPAKSRFSRRRKFGDDQRL